MENMEILAKNKYELIHKIIEKHNLNVSELDDYNIMDIMQAMCDDNRVDSIYIIVERNLIYHQLSSAICNFAQDEMKEIEGYPEDFDFPTAIYKYKWINGVFIATNMGDTKDVYKRWADGDDDWVENPNIEISIKIDGCCSKDILHDISSLISKKYPQISYDCEFKELKKYNRD